MDTWVSYEIHPETPAQGISLERLFGPALREGQEGQRRRCAELGLPFDPPRSLSNSRLAIEAAEFARKSGRHAQFHRAVLAAYFAHSLDIGDVEVLAGVAQDVGLDPGLLRRDLAAGTYAAAREEARAEAFELGVTAVPTYLFPGEARVVGAQPLDHFRRLLARFASEDG